VCLAGQAFTNIAHSSPIGRAASIASCAAADHTSRPRGLSIDGVPTVWTRIASLVQPRAPSKNVGKALGDPKPQAAGKSDKAEGKAQNALGGLKNEQKK
jgi:hypothetical protein